MADRYEPAAFEAKWRARWQAAELFRTREDEGRPKFYGLDFFPYPSGAGLSVGHCRNYLPTDVICRMKYMQGYNVLHPMGFDSFGLPAENEAIKNKTHPRPMIERYAATYRRQMELIGISYDWSRSFSSCDPSYVRWTQWIFELLYKKGLAYRDLASVNWDPVDKTVLADEEVVAGRAERSGALVEKKFIPQWYFRITAHAQRLIDDLDGIDWPEGIKSQQRNWIGRSEGVRFAIKVASGRKPEGEDADAMAADGDAFDTFEIRRPERTLTFEVFTTRIDTIFGMTFCVLAPEHPLVDHLLGLVDEEHRAAVREYQEQAKRLSETDRLATTREKTGVFTGAYGINPANGKPVPIWIADYVLASYGTGAIMAVPAGDQRDFEFAMKFGLDVIPVNKPTEEYLRGFAPAEFDYDVELTRYRREPKAFDPVFTSKDSVMMDSGEYNGLGFAEATRVLGEWLEGLGIGERQIKYRLRDWLISRQRYWGCPIPVIHSADGDLQLVPEDCLPVELPDVENYEPTGDGSSPLARIADWVNVTDLDGRLGRRETDTMGGFADSSWYFLRFCDPHNDEKGWDPAKAAYWMPVDCYVGGAEHAVMHLLYARFWTKVLFDEGLVPTPEPFQRLQNQGQVLALTAYRKPHEGEQLEVGEEGILISFAEAETLPEDQLFYRWARMSKSKGNVVTPDEMVEAHGADALRIYLLFVAPFEADVQWKNEGVQAAGRFLTRVFRLADELRGIYAPEWRGLLAFEELDEPARKMRRTTHQTIRKATADIERFAFNTYVSSLMDMVNKANDLLREAGPSEPSRAFVLAASEALETLILLLSPGAPHSADELWEGLDQPGTTFQAEWPNYDEALAAEDAVTIALQVNGKLRDTLEMPVGTAKEDLERAALATPKVQQHIGDKTVRKVIVIPDRLVNIVAS